MTEEDAYHALCAYTLEHARRDPSFLHQNVVDAFTAQRADHATRPVAVVFSLLGLYLHVERGFTGKEVQRVHVLLAQRKHTWPDFPLPPDRGALTSVEVLAVPPGPERDRAIAAWCASVWQAYAESRPLVLKLLEEHDIG